MFTWSNTWYTSSSEYTQTDKLPVAIGDPSSGLLIHPTKDVFYVSGALSLRAVFGSCNTFAFKTATLRNEHPGNILHALLGLVKTVRVRKGSRAAVCAAHIACLKATLQLCLTKWVLIVGGDPGVASNDANSARLSVGVGRVILRKSHDVRGKLPQIQTNAIITTAT